MAILKNDKISLGNVRNFDVLEKKEGTRIFETQEEARERVEKEVLIDFRKFEDKLSIRYKNGKNIIKCGELEAQHLWDCNKNGLYEVLKDKNGNYISDNFSSIMYLFQEITENWFNEKCPNLKKQGLYFETFCTLKSRSNTDLLRKKILFLKNLELINPTIKWNGAAASCATCELEFYKDGQDINIEIEVISDIYIK